VVARAFKKDKLGSSDRKFVAETIYDGRRWKRLYAEIAEVKEPFDRDNLWRMFAVWVVLEAIQPDWRQLEGTPNKRRFDELSSKSKEALLDG
jgi:16S rRNA (cytosine967-C5)-methyltransferase